MTNSWSLRSAAVTSANALQTHMVLPFVTSLRSRKSSAAGTSFHMVLVDPASLCGLRPYMFSADALPSAYHGCAAGHRWPTWPGALSASRPSSIVGPPASGTGLAVSVRCPLAVEPAVDCGNVFEWAGRPPSDTLDRRPPMVVSAGGGSRAQIVIL